MLKKTLPFSMRLDADLKAELQKLADAENRSLTNFVETQLRKLVAEREREARPRGRK
jgi:predicted transcriptional regulator